MPNSGSGEGPLISDRKFCYPYGYDGNLIRLVSLGFQVLIRTFLAADFG